MAGRTRRNWDPCRQKLETLATLLLFNHRRSSRVVTHGGPFDVGMGSAANWAAADQGLRFVGGGAAATASFTSTTNSKFCKESCNHHQTMEIDNKVKVQDVHPRLPEASQSSVFSNWMKWLWGSLISVMLPLWSNNWDGLLRLEGKVEKVAEEVAVAAEVVEKVATAADKALAEVANQLPDITKLKETAQAMEHASEVAAQDAHLIQNILHKVGDVKQDLEDLESMVKPVFNKGHSRP